MVVNLLFGIWVHYYLARLYILGIHLARLVQGPTFRRHKEAVPIHPERTLVLT